MQRTNGKPLAGLVCGLLTLCFAVSGCGADPAPTGSASPPPAATGTATPSPTPSSTPVGVGGNTLVDPDNMVLITFPGRFTVENHDSDALGYTAFDTADGTATFNYICEEKSSALTVRDYEKQSINTYDGCETKVEDNYLTVTHTAGAKSWILLCYVTEDKLYKAEMTFPTGQLEEYAALAEQVSILPVDEQ